MRLPDDVRMSDRLTKLLNFLRYGSIKSLIFGWRMSSLTWGGVAATVGTACWGAGAGTAHWVGGVPGGGSPYGTVGVVWVSQSKGNIAPWIGMAFWTASVIHLRYDVEKLNVDPGAKSEATGFWPKNERPSSMMAHVIRAHTSLVYAFLIVKHSSWSRMR